MMPIEFSPYLGAFRIFYSILAAFRREAKRTWLSLAMNAPDEHRALPRGAFHPLKLNRRLSDRDQVLYCQRRKSMSH